MTTPLPRTIFAPPFPPTVPAFYRPPYHVRAPIEPATTVPEIVPPPPTDDIKLSQLLVAAGVLHFAKTPEGMSAIKEWGKQYIKGTFDTLHALAQASSANVISAWASPTLIAAVLRRLQLLPKGFLGQYMIALNLVLGAEVVGGFVDDIAKLIPFTDFGKHEDAPFPEQIVFSAREAGVEVPEQISWKEMTELLKATLTKKK